MKRIKLFFSIFLIVPMACILTTGFDSDLKVQIEVESLLELRSAIVQSNQSIAMKAGRYNLEDLGSESMVMTFSGSNNTIDLSGVYIQVPVGSIRESYMLVTGNDITIKGGEIEDTYRNGLKVVDDFSAYNQDRTNLAYGLKGAAVMTVSGDNNVISGLKLTTRGSFPYGYGSMYGIGRGNAYGLDKRCGILINGKNNTLNNVEVQQRAFGHAIYTQSPADNTTIKNCYVEGRLRATADFYNETDSNDLPYKSDYNMPFDEAGGKYDFPIPIPKDDMFTLMEDGIRVYNKGGSITVQNSVVKKARGGIRLYFSPDATVTNSMAIDCGSTNFNLPSGGHISGSKGNFTYAPLSDFRLAKSNQDIEITILPSPHATKSHNIADVQGNNHNIVFHRTPGPIDKIKRAIVVKGNNSTIINETEYAIVLESSTSGNTIHTCGPIIDHGKNNKIITLESCSDF